MHDNPPQPEFPQYGQPPMAGGPTPWSGEPMAPPPRPRANAAAAVTASILAVLTVIMFVWFAFYNVVHLHWMAADWFSVFLVNVLGGAVAAGSLLVAAGFTFIRRIPGAWSLSGMCALYVVAIFVAAPLLWGTPFDAQLEFVLGFDEGNDVAIGLATIFAGLTAITAAIAASVKSYEPTTATPPHP